MAPRYLNTMSPFLLVAPFLAVYLWRRSRKSVTAAKPKVRRDVRVLTKPYAVHLIREAAQCDAILCALFDKAAEMNANNGGHSSSSDNHENDNRNHNAEFSYNFPKCVIGFDAEWQPTKGSRVALVQIALPFQCLLIQIHHMNTLPKMLKALLESQHVVKVGVGVAGDAHRMSKDWGVHVRGCVDLRNLASFRSATFGAGLKTMTEGVLGLHYPSELVAQQRSDWQAPHLTQAQLDYATADAVVGWHIAYSLCKVTAGTEQSMATPTVGVEDLGASPDWVHFYEFCEDFEGQPLPKSATHVPPNDKEQGGEVAYRPSKSIPTTSTRKRPMHENVRIVSYDNRVLGYTSRRRIAKGIVARGDGVFAPASEGPWDPIAVGYHASRTIVKLTDPRTAEWAETDVFMRHPRRNKCCVCGACGPNCRGHESCVKAPGGLSAHKVVPTQYYRYLTQREYVHDTLLVCNKCGDRIRFLYRGETDRVATRYNAPLHGINDKAQLRQNPDYQARTYAKTLLDMLCDKFGVNGRGGRPQKREKKKGKKGKDADNENNGNENENENQNTTTIPSDANPTLALQQTTTSEEESQPAKKRGRRGGKKSKTPTQEITSPTQATSNDDGNAASITTPQSTPTPAPTPLVASPLPPPPASTTGVISSKDLTLSEEETLGKYNGDTFQFSTSGRNLKQKSKKKGGSKGGKKWRPSGAPPSEWLGGVAGPASAASAATIENGEAGASSKMPSLPTGAGIDREACEELFYSLPTDVHDTCVMNIPIRIPRERVGAMVKAILDNEMRWRKEAVGEGAEELNDNTEGNFEGATSTAAVPVEEGKDRMPDDEGVCSCPCPESGICITPRVLLECLCRDDTHLSFVPHGWLVMQHVIDDVEQSLAFVRRWRQFFIDSVQPKRLPMGWSVDYVAPDTELTTLLISDPDNYDGAGDDAGALSEGEDTDEES